MTSPQKTIAVWLGLALAAILSIFLLVSTNQKLNTAAPTNTVSFSGEGKVVTKPDVAVVNLAIVSEAATSKAAQDDNSAKSKKVTDFLKKQNIDEKDVKTSGYNIYPQYKYPQFDKPRIQGYQVNQTLAVKIRDLAKVSNILDGVVTAGVNQVNNLSFQVDQPEELKAKARELAINDARDKANKLKSQLGIRLGRIVNFSEGLDGFPPPVFYEKGLAIGGGGPEVPAGENEITVNVTITYQIK
ncbi:MAG: SIMPL domain-containing protein [Patescibacteria group bacterium]